MSTALKEETLAIAEALLADSVPKGLGVACGDVCRLGEGDPAGDACRLGENDPDERADITL